LAHSVDWTMRAAMQKDSRSIRASAPPLPRDRLERPSAYLGVVSALQGYASRRGAGMMSAPGHSLPSPMTSGLPRNGQPSRPVSMSQKCNERHHSATSNISDVSSVCRRSRATRHSGASDGD
jgi:hypothetical protein